MGNELQEKAISELAKGMSIEDIMISVLNSQKEVKASVEEVKENLAEVKNLANEIDKKVHIDDVEASEIKSIIGRNAYKFAKFYFEKAGHIASDNLFSSKKGQFIRLQYSRLKKAFNVTKYTHIKHTEAQKAFTYLENLAFEDFSLFEIRETQKQKEILAMENNVA